MYLPDRKGKRHYFYHPADDLQREEFFREQWNMEAGSAEARAFLKEHEGCELDFFCRDCGALSRIEPRLDPMKCTACRGTDLLDAQDLEGVPCPRCRQGVLHGSPGAIS